MVLGLLREPFFCNLLTSVPLTYIQTQIKRLFSTICDVPKNRSSALKLFVSECEFSKMGIIIVFDC